MGGQPVGYLHNAVKELNSGLPRINPDSEKVDDLNVDLQISNPEGFPLGSPFSLLSTKTNTPRSPFSF